MDGQKIIEVVGYYKKIMKERDVYPTIAPVSLTKIPSSFREAVGIIDRKKLKKKEVVLKKFPEEEYPKSKREILCHCRSLIPEGKEYSRQGKEGKSLRRTGFVSGCLYLIERWPKNPEHEAIFLKALLSSTCALLSTIEFLVREGNLMGAFWCLGWIQGIFWASGVFTIQELKEHNKPNEEEYSEKE